MKNTIVHFQDEIAAIVLQHLKKRKYRLFLFGSRARNEASPYSDYDLAILGTEPLPLATLSLIRGDLESLPILQKIDLVDLATASKQFKNEILRNGLLLDEH